MEEILENKVNAKKRKASIVTAQRAVTNKVEEDDEVYVSDLTESVGSYIKNKALEKYQDFNSHVTQEQTMISLGMSSILDLSYTFNQGQSCIFSQNQWNELRARFPLVERESTGLGTNLLNLKTCHSLILRQLSKTRFGVEKKLKSLSKNKRTQTKTRMKHFSCS